VGSFSFVENNGCLLSRDLSHRMILAWTCRELGEAFLILGEIEKSHRTLIEMGNYARNLRTLRGSLDEHPKG